ncbi:MAG: hypothetical protein ACOZQL_20010 [Myxococcota bacterium]
MLTLVPGRAPHLQRSPEPEVLLDAGFSSTPDGFRGDRLLLVRQHRARYPERVMADAALFDFSTAQARMLGLFPGATAHRMECTRRPRCSGAPVRMSTA